MPPRKRTVVERSTTVPRSSSRVTKVNAESPKKKKAKKSPSEKKLEADIHKTEAETEISPAAAEGKVEDGLKRKTIIIEHCKQCNSFKTRALQVKSGLEKGLDGVVNVIVNPEKPRRGCFEIREEGENGEKFISLLNMKRPFAPMKALDMEQVISGIIEKKLEADKPKTEAEVEAKAETEVSPAAAEEKVEDGLKRKTIIIEHCKQCNSFKARALQVKSGLEKCLESGVNVIVNPEKPRRGCFEIREEGENGEKFISLLNMKRPFAPMKALDMEQVISDIIEKIK